MKKVALKRVSKKQEAELEKRRELRSLLLYYNGFKCMTCKGLGDWRGLSLSHKVPLSRGGLTDYENCLIECYPCHEKRHNLIRRQR